jgi:hypothetical protein
MASLFGFAYRDTALRYLEKEVPAKIRGQIKRRIQALAAQPMPPGSRSSAGSWTENIRSIAYAKETIESSTLFGQSSSWFWT